MAEISVVIPTCDRADTLREAVNCVLNQSHHAAEIIVVNNGGHPLENQLLPRQVKVYELPPYAGVSRARNHGASHATGEYVAFLDDDDLWENEYLAKVLLVVKEHHPDCIIARKDKLINGSIHPYKNAEHGLDLATLLVSNPGIGGSTTIVRREAFERISGYDINLKTSEDKALIIDFILNGYSVVTAAHIQAILREHDNSRLRDSESVFEGIAGFLNKYGRLMSPAQRNFNLLRFHYHRFLAKRQAQDYILFWFCYLRHYAYRRINSGLPEAPRIPVHGLR